MTRPIPRILLAVSGTMGLAIGAAILFQPHGFMASSGITLGADPSLLSEVRAPGGFLIVCSLLMLAGAVRQKMMLIGLLLSALLYGTYGLSRLVSITFDGLPSNSLLTAMTIELIIGALSLTVLLRQTPATGDIS